MKGRKGISILVLLMSFFTLSFAQEAKTIPVSGKIVEWKFVLPDGNWVKGKVLEGGMTRIEKKGELILGFSPIIRDEKERKVEVQVFQIERVSEGIEKIKALERLEVTPVENIYNHKGYSFRIKVEKIIDASKRLEKGELLPSIEGGRCCVTCGEWTACCCAVEHSCGSCCSDPCCRYIQ